MGLRDVDKMLPSKNKVQLGLASSETITESGTSVLFKSRSPNVYYLMGTF